MRQLVFGISCAALVCWAAGFGTPARACSADRLFIDADSVRTVSGFVMRDGWRYHPGDDPAWAEPTLDDCGWATGTSHLVPHDDSGHVWRGIGWFRLRFTVDPKLAGVPLALHMVQAGASEIYLDGRLLYRLGQVAGEGDEEVAFWDQAYPRVIVLRGEHVLAVRYSNVSTGAFRRLGYGQGFYIQLGELPAQIQERVDRERRMRAMQVLFTVVPLVFSLLHLFLYLFYRRSRENLYYALLTACLAASSFFDLEGPFAENPGERLLQVRLFSVFSVMAVLFGLRAVYRIRGPSLPRQFHAFLVAGAVLVAWRLIEPSEDNRFASDVFTFVALAEGLRVLATQRPSSGVVGWVVGSGAVLAIVAMMLQLSLRLEVLGVPIYYVGVSLMLLALSLYISDRFASTSRRLEQQLEQVRDLTARTLEQERRAREMDFERRALEAENARKSQELEAARRLQLSMLPQTIPAPPHLDVAAYMQTATEVGGDYYDFHLSEHGAFTIAVGDATGHGTAAGIMAAAVKSLFTAMAATADLRQIFHQCTRIIKPMRLGSIFMALVLARIDGRRLVASSAGMPYPLVYRRATGTVEALVLKGMPLGLVSDFPYGLVEVMLEPGDVLLLMSDGLTERFNERREQFTEDQVRAQFAAAAGGTAEDVICALVEAGERWRNGSPASDDMTFVVVKVRDEEAH